MFIGRERELESLKEFYDKDGIGMTVIRASICTGERVAGFRYKSGNGFVEAMVIHNDYEKELFMKAYNLENIKNEY